MNNSDDLIKEELEKSKEYYFNAYNENNKIVEISIRNVLLAEAMSNNDSTYIKASDEKAYPTIKSLEEIKKEYSLKYDFKNVDFYNKCKNKGTYKGSSAFWFGELKKMNLIRNTNNDDKYKFILSGAAQSVDRENSTHLNSDNQRYEVIERLYKYTPSELFDLIINPKDEFRLINEISDKTHPKNIKVHNPKTGKDNNKYYSKSNFSFATKFCHNYSVYIFNGADRDKYSIFDNILKKSLPLYLKHFNISLDEYKRDNMCDKAKEYINNNDYCNFLKYIGESIFDDNDNLTKGTKYKIYLDIISKIINKSNQKISRNGFDHLLWYYYKGREIINDVNN